MDKDKAKQRQRYGIYFIKSIMLFGLSSLFPLLYVYGLSYTVCWDAIPTIFQSLFLSKVSITISPQQIRSP